MKCDSSVSEKYYYAFVNIHRESYGKFAFVILSSWCFWTSTIRKSAILCTLITLHHTDLFPKRNAGLELPGDLGDKAAFRRLTSPYLSSAAKSKSLYFSRSRFVHCRQRSVNYQFSQIARSPLLIKWLTFPTHAVVQTSNLPRFRIGDFAPTMITCQDVSKSESVYMA